MTPSPFHGFYENDQERINLQDKVESNGEDDEWMAEDKELSIYRQAKIEAANARATMSSDEFLKFWEERNASLRDMGIRLLPLDD